MVTVEYRVVLHNGDSFFGELKRLEHERKRDGAYARGIYEDAAEPEKFVEAFYVKSWLEHLRHHIRVTKADRLLQEHVHRYVAKLPTSDILSPQNLERSFRTATWLRSETPKDEIGVGSRRLAAVFALTQFGPQHPGLAATH